MASANAIGTGSVILTANADGLAQGLDKAAGKVDAWGKRVQATTDRAAASIGKSGVVEKGRALFGQVGGLGGVGEFLGVGGGVGAMAVAANAVATVAANVESLNRALAESKRLTDKFEQNFGVVKQTGDEIARIAELGNREDQAAAVAARIEALEKNKAGLENQLNTAKARVDELSGFAAEQARGIPGLVGRAQQEKFDEANRNLEQLRKNYEGTTESIARLTKEAEKFTANAAGKALMVEDQKRFESMTKGVDEMTRSLKEQAATLGMTAGQVAVYKAEALGATGTQLAGLRAAAEELDRVQARAENVRKAFRAAFNSDKLPSERKLGAAMEQGSAAAFSVVAKHSVQGMGVDGKSQADRVVRANERVVSAVEKMTKLLDEKLNFISF